MKYITIKISGVISGIGKRLDSSSGTYSEIIIERLLISDEEMDKMSDKKIQSWIKRNNKFMTELCELMNKHKIKC